MKLASLSDICRLSFQVGSVLSFCLLINGPAQAQSEAQSEARASDDVRFQFAPAKVATLSPFTTDVCTHFPNGTKEQPMLWANCCVIHDLSYWVGGSAEERLNADKSLRSCVAATGHPDIAQAMFLGVRVGGAPNYKTPWRWGYGWNEIRGYKALTNDERAQLLALQPEI